jgi:hypothetical protein
MGDKNGVNIQNCFRIKLSWLQRYTSRPVILQEWLWNRRQAITDKGVSVVTRWRNAKCDVNSTAVWLRDNRGIGWRSEAETWYSRRLHEENVQSDVKATCILMVLTEQKRTKCTASNRASCLLKFDTDISSWKDTEERNILHTTKLSWCNNFLLKRFIERNIEGTGIGGRRHK